MANVAGKRNLETLSILWELRESSFMLSKVRTLDVRRASRGRD